MRRLYRSQSDRVLGGVCGGIAEYFQVDSTLVRLVWIFFTLFGGSGILAYFLALLIIPDEIYRDHLEVFTKHDFIADRKIGWGIFLVIVGLILFFMHTDLLSMLWTKFWHSGVNIFLGVIVIGWGVYLLYTRRKELSHLWEEGKRLPLHLSIHDRRIAGVCGGLGETLHIDSTIIRFFWVYGTLMSAGAGILLYILLALMLPDDNIYVEQE